MAQVPYEHIEAPEVIRIDGVRAYNPGDPVPVEVAQRLGLLDAEDAPPVLAGTGPSPAAGAQQVSTTHPLRAEET